MEKDRSFKVMSIAALLVGVVGISLGFAAFSNTLTISSGAEVAAGNFDVNFSSKANAEDTTAITATVVGATADAAQINNTGNPTLTGLNAKFTAPGQKVTYTAYAYNAGALEAWLTSVVFSGEKNCDPTGENPGSESIVALACEDITFNVKVGDQALTDTSITNIKNDSVTVGASDVVTVEIEYPAGSQVVDGGMEVSFPDVVLTYSSVPQNN